MRGGFDTCASAQGADGTVATHAQSNNVHVYNCRSVVASLVATRKSGDNRRNSDLTDTTRTTMRSPTIKDVAKRAKVSLKTVSRVINHEPSVLTATRERVERVIADPDYRPTQSPPSLRTAT